MPVLLPRDSVSHAVWSLSPAVKNDSDLVRMVPGTYSGSTGASLASAAFTSGPRRTSMRKLLVGGAVVLASVAGVAAPAFAHDCFNPKKPIGAGSVGTLTIDPNNPD